MSEKTRQRPLPNYRSAAYDVIMEKGIKQASIKEIAARAEVAPGLIHYYFKAKDDLYIAVAQESSKRFRARMAALGKSTPAADLPEAALGAVKNGSKQSRTSIGYVMISLPSVCTIPNFNLACLSC